MHAKKNKKERFMAYKVLIPETVAPEGIEH